jgi:S-adenosylmethionine decarboxylase
MLGKELIADVEDIEDYSVLETIDGIRPLMEKIIENCGLNGVGKCEHQFSPYGATMLYLLSESHLTVHTYVKERSCSINLYTCNPNTDFKEALEIIYKFFKQPFIIKKIMER